jgi:hypothetical protein
MASDVGDGDARGVEAMIWQLKLRKLVDHRYWVAERLSRGLSKKGLGPHSAHRARDSSLPHAEMPKPMERKRGCANKRSRLNIPTLGFGRQNKKPRWLFGRLGFHPVQSGRQMFVKLRLAA